MSSLPPCIAWAEKLALRREDLSQSEREALDAHVADCIACQQAQAHYHYLDAALRALPQPTVKPFPRLSLLLGAQDTAAEPELESVIIQNDSSEEFDLAVWQPERRQQHTRRSIFHKRPGEILPVVAVICLLLGFVLVEGMYNAKMNVVRSSGTVLLTYRQHSGFVSAVAWSPDGRYIATGSWDHTVQVWGAKSGILLTTYSGHSEIVDALAWSPDGKYIASGSWDRTAQVWETGT